MNGILIRENLLEQVIKGEKTTTCRLGRREYPLVKMIMRSNSSNNFCVIKVLKTEYVAFGNITDEIAKKDGFETRGNFIDVMRDIYGDVKPDDVITIVFFEVVDELRKSGDADEAARS